MMLHIVHQRGSSRTDTSNGIGLRQGRSSCQLCGPGFIETDQMRAYIASHHENSVSVKRQIIDLHPLGRVGQPAEVAAVVAFWHPMMLHLLQESR